VIPQAHSDIAGHGPKTHETRRPTQGYIALHKHETSSKATETRGPRRERRQDNSQTLPPMLCVPQEYTHIHPMICRYGFLLVICP